MKCAYFVYLSTITQIEFLSCDWGSCSIKSMVMCCQAWLGMGKSWRSPGVLVGILMLADLALVASHGIILYFLSQSWPPESRLDPLESSIDTWMSSISWAMHVLYYLLPQVAGAPYTQSPFEFEYPIMVGEQRNIVWKSDVVHYGFICFGIILTTVLEFSHPIWFQFCKSMASNLSMVPPRKCISYLILCSIL